MRFYIENVKINDYDGAYFFIRQNQGFCFTTKHEFIKHSNDWYYLIRNREPEIPIISNMEIIFIEKKVIPLITSFHTGVHAYSGIYSILFNLFKIKQEGYKFLVYRNIQSGILDIIKALLGEDNLIFLDHEVLYKFKNILLIPNSLHSFLESEEFSLKISDFIQNNFAKKRNDYIENVAILKTDRSSVSSKLGVVSEEASKKFFEKNNYKIVEPSEIGEIETINILYNCINAAFSWGTTFMKNYIYLSDKCEIVDVFIFGAEFVLEYESAIQRGLLIEKFRNCKFNYHIEPNLNSSILKK